MYFFFFHRIISKSIHCCCCYRCIVLTDNTILQLPKFCKSLREFLVHYYGLRIHNSTSTKWYQYYTRDGCYSKAGIYDHWDYGCNSRFLAGAFSCSSPNITTLKYFCGVLSTNLSAAILSCCTINELEIFAATYVDGSLLILVSQSSVPISMILSSFILKRHYTKIQV